MTNLIVAYDQEHAVGRKNGLLWGCGEMRGDMKHFCEFTSDTIIFMQRKTLNPISTVVPQHRSIVLMHQDSVKIPDVEVAHSIESVSALNAMGEQSFAIGGSQVYEHVPPCVQKVFATELNAVIKATDIYDYDFFTYDRK